MVRTSSLRQTEMYSSPLGTPNVLPVALVEQKSVPVLRHLPLGNDLTAERSDPLTGLLHRPALIDAVDKEVGRGGAFGLLSIALDGFRNVNDTLGHDVGDEILRRVAQKLVETSRASEIVARIGGDEFAVMMPGIGRERQLRLAMIRYRRCLASVASDVKLPNLLKGSIGAAIYPLHASSRPQLIKCAELALREAKQAGGDQARCFEQRAMSLHETRARMRSRAADCLRFGNRLVTYYQRKVDLQSGETVGYEALLRCVDASSQIHGPSWILAAFEDPSLAVSLGQCVQRQMLHSAQQLHLAGQASRIALNVTSWELQNPDWPMALLDQMRRLDLPPNAIEIEVTENVLLGPHSRPTYYALEQLQAEGVTITLDDFGTGYASLTHLRSCPVDGLKIDKSFISDFDSPRSAAIVEATINLARALGLTVIAEGVETTEQHDWLRHIGCHQGQGYLYGRPTPQLKLS